MPQHAQVPPAARRPRRRRWPWALAVLLLLLAGAAWWMARLLEPGRLSAFVLAQASAATGLELELPQPADISLWPDLHIEMRGLQARAPGSPEALFSAARVDLVLPWSALLHGDAVIRHLRLLQPRLDRDALSAWLATREQPGPPAPFELPELTASLSIEGGLVHGADAGAWQLRALALDTSALHAAEPFHAEVSAELSTGAESEPLQIGFTLDTIPSVRDGSLSLDPLRLAVGWPGLDAPLAVEGRVLLDPPRRLQVQLAGELAAWPRQWPTLPVTAADANSDVPTTFSIGYDGPADGSGSATAALERGTAALDLQAQPTAVVGWATDPARPPLPPARANLQAERLELGGAALSGVTATLEPDAALPAQAPGKPAQ